MNRLQSWKKPINTQLEILIKSVLKQIQIYILQNQNLAGHYFSVVADSEMNILKLGETSQHLTKISILQSL